MIKEKSPQLKVSVPAQETVIAICWLSSTKVSGIPGEPDTTIFPLGEFLSSSSSTNLHLVVTWAGPEVSSATRLGTAEVGL